MTSGLTATMSACSSPARRSDAGRRLVTNTSHPAATRSSAERPAGWETSIAALRLFRSRFSETPDSPPRQVPPGRGQANVGGQGCEMADTWLAGGGTIRTGLLIDVTIAVSAIDALPKASRMTIFRIWCWWSIQNLIRAGPSDPRNGRSAVGIAVASERRSMTPEYSVVATPPTL